MRKKKKFTWFFVAIILFVFYISFFYMERTEINDVDILLVIGVDKVDEGYQVTGLYNKNGGVDQATGGTKLIDGTGSSFYEAYQDLVRKNLKSVSIAHTTYFVFGEDVAKEGILPCLDYVERDQTVKMNAMIYILRDTTANKLLQKSINAKTQIQEDLTAISDKQVDNLKVVDNTLLRVSQRLEEGYGTLLVPYLVSEGDYLYINGYGIFEEDRLVGYLDGEQSMALDLLRNRLRTYPIYLNGQIALEITESQTAKEVSIVNGGLRTAMHISFESDIKEVTTTDHLYEDYYIQQLEELQNQYIANKVDELIEIAETYNIDLFGVADKFRSTYSRDWETISSNWNYYFRNIIYQYDIQSQTAQSYVVAS